MLKHKFKNLTRREAWRINDVIEYIRRHSSSKAKCGVKQPKQSYEVTLLFEDEEALADYREVFEKGWPRISRRFLV